MPSPHARAWWQVLLVSSRQWYQTAVRGVRRFVAGPRMKEVPCVMRAGANISPKPTQRSKLVLFNACWVISHECTIPCSGRYGREQTGWP
jgi:hypothetical protein